ncbi:MAG: HAD family hydrolase [Planctomycetota bacterium]|nr:HAD family hydrolase [Planctomycetota bacterium]
MTSPSHTILQVPASAQPPLRWVALDAVGTVIYPDPPVRQVYFQSAKRHGSQFTEAEIEQRFRTTYVRLEEESTNGYQTSENLEEERWRAVVREVLSDVPDPATCFRELFDWFASPNAWRVYADVAPALALLAQLGVSTAVASNFDRRLHPVLNGLPELASIPLRVVSSEVGYRKPASEFFAALQSQTNSPADQIAMVGDSHANDVEGALRAGLRAVWIDRRRPAGEGHVQTLAEAVDRLFGSRRIPIE